MKAKQIAGEKAAEFVKDGMTIGLGSGSTAAWATRKIGELVKEGLNIRAVPTSEETRELAKELEIPLTTLSEVRHIDLTIDGADEVDNNLNLIKGGGGALVREKIVAHESKRLIIVVDESKLVKKLGAFPLPVEVVHFGCDKALINLEKLGCQAHLREEGDEVFNTDNDNYIIDCNFEVIDNPEKLNTTINILPGVVESGLFINMAERVVVGREDGSVEIIE
ncbi:MAG TPA: ribose-5-phosphate isomerase RpiA [Halanaerobiales bacterium]|nr:ribose-5-phosphate isomerase RpiA [Halanaerobiales bacterium]